MSSLWCCLGEGPHGGSSRTDTSWSPAIWLLSKGTPSELKGVGVRLGGCPSWVFKCLGQSWGQIVWGFMVGSSSSSLPGSRETGWVLSCCSIRNGGNSCEKEPLNQSSSLILGRVLPLWASISLSANWVASPGSAHLTALQKTGQANSCGRACKLD